MDVFIKFRTTLIVNKALGAPAEHSWKPKILPIYS